MIADGRVLAEQVIAEIMVKMQYLPPKRLAFVIFGENTDSTRYVGVKSRVAGRLGIEVSIIQKDCINTEMATEEIKSVAQEGYSGIVVQLPLPAGMDTQAVLNAIPLECDIDMLGIEAHEAYLKGGTRRVAPVAMAVKSILEQYNINLVGKQVVLLGSGRLVGEPIAMMLDKDDIPYTVVDAYTEESLRDELLKNADVVISGIGVGGFVKPSMIKEGVILIDAGTSEQAGVLVGDIDPSCAEKAFLYTPVPGGVGPVTVACLFQNLYK